VMPFCSFPRCSQKVGFSGGNLCPNHDPAERRKRRVVRLLRGLRWAVRFKDRQMCEIIKREIRRLREL
jgi:hypothetical protein